MKMFFRILAFSLGVIAGHCAIRGRGDTTQKVYYLPDGQTRSCVTRTEHQKCPFDHEIGVCKKNGTLTECVSCDLAAGYRNCHRVYSRTRDVKCSRPSLNCQPEHITVVTNTTDGGCIIHCVCDHRKGYVANGSDCVPLGTKCGINSTIIDGKCTDCPPGQYKLTEGYEPCMPLPTDTATFQIFTVSFGTTSSILNEADTNGNSSDKNPGQPDIADSQKYLAIFIPLGIFLAVVIIIIIGVCFWKKRKGSESLGLFNISCSDIWRLVCCKGYQTFTPVPVEDTPGDVCLEPNPAKEVRPPLPVPSDEETETESFLPNNQETVSLTNEMSSSAKFKSFPTLRTKGKSSLPITNLFSDRDDTTKTTPTHNAASIKQGEEEEKSNLKEEIAMCELGSATLDPYDFGSSFSVISKSNNEVGQ